MKVGIINSDYWPDFNIEEYDDLTQYDYVVELPSEIFHRIKTLNMRQKTIDKFCFTGYQDE